MTEFEANLIGSVVERRGDAARNPEGFGKITAYETNRLSGSRVGIRLSGTNRRIFVSSEEFDRDWTILNVDGVLPEVGWATCLRCGRIHAEPGGCPSWTCRTSS